MTSLKMYSTNIPYDQNITFGTYKEPRKIIMFYGLIYNYIVYKYINKECYYCIERKILYNHD